MSSPSSVSGVSGVSLSYRDAGVDIDAGDALVEALTLAADARAMALSPGVLPYLITHFQRDMRSLSAMLDALDRYSLETQRPITLPLLRNLLQREGEPPA